MRILAFDKIENEIFLVEKGFFNKKIRTWGENEKIMRNLGFCGVEFFVYIS